MATAIYAKTESADTYLFCVDANLTAREVQDYLRQELGEEYDYISEYETQISSQSVTRIPSDSKD